MDTSNPGGVEMMFMIPVPPASGGLAGGVPVAAVVVAVFGVSGFGTSGVCAASASSNFFDICFPACTSTVNFSELTPVSYTHLTLPTICSV